MDSKKKEYNLKVGKAIKKIRKEAGLTQAQVAEKAGIKVNYFAVIERGEVKTSGENLAKIAEALGVDASVIVNPK